MIGSILGLLRQGLLRQARQRATRILTPAEWATFPAQREQARRARMAEEKVSFAAVMRRRVWSLMPEELKAEARGSANFEEGSGSSYDYFPHLDAAAVPELHRTATAEILGLVKARKLRFVRDGKNVSSKLTAGKHTSVEGEATDLASEAECTLLELVEAGLPEWVELGRAEDFTPLEFRGPVAVLQDVRPEYLDEQRRFVDPGWQQIEEQLRRAFRPDKLKRFSRKSLRVSCSSASF